MFRTLLLVAASYCFAFTANAQSKTYLKKVHNPGIVCIAARLTHADSSTPRVMAVNFLNPFIPGRQSAVFKEQDRCTAKSEMLFTQNMTIQYNDEFINLYVTPGDSVQLAIDAEKLDQPDFAWLTITGDHALISTQLNHWYQFANSIPNMPSDLSLPPAKLKQAIRMDYERYMRLLDVYAKQHRLDPIVINWAKSDIRFAISNRVQDYTDAPAISLRARRERVDVFSDPFFAISDESNFSSMMFPYHLSAYFHARCKSDTAYMNARAAGDEQRMIATALHLAGAEPMGYARDYMIFSFLEQVLRGDPHALDKQQDVTNVFTYPESYQYLLAAREKILHPRFAETVLHGVISRDTSGVQSVLPSVDLMQLLSTLHPGKKLYIDVYATWCVPCLEEMSYGDALRTQINDTNLVFVNLCLESAESAWRKLLVDKALKGENYFLPPDATKAFMGGYQVSGFPTYILVDANGKISTMNAPRPSEPKKMLKALGEMD